jgi:hypothetical protein
MSMRRTCEALDSPVGDPAAKLVLIALCDNAGGPDDDLAWPSIATLMRRTELSESTVRRKLQYLVSRGQLEQIGVNPRTGTQMYRTNPTATTETGGVTVTGGGVTQTERGVTVTPEPLRNVTEQERARARTTNQSGYRRSAGPGTSISRGSATGQRPSAALAEFDRAAAAALPLDETRQRAAAIAERLAGNLGNRA